MSFFRSLENHKKNVAIYQEDAEPVLYEELARIADRIAAHIENKKALVLIFCSNDKDCVAGYLACLRAGHVPLLLDAAINKELAQNLLETHKPHYIWAPNDSFDYKRPKFRWGNYVLVDLHYGEHLLYPDLALLLTTSGSTGSPKLVRLSYKNIESNAHSIAEYLELDETQRPITTLPMNYTYGLSIINSHLLAGAAIILTNHTVMQKEFWAVFRQYGATSFGGVPYTYEMLKKLRFFSMNLPTLRAMTQAGGKLNYEMTKEYAQYSEQKGLRFYVMYGASEATARMSYLPYQYALSKCGSMGVAIPGGKFSLADDAGNEITQPERPGELVYQGPNVSLGYAECLDDLSKGDENNGVLYTGDMAKRDDDGFYYIVGRKKRFIKIFGNRVNLDEIEQMVKNKGYECACTGKDDQMIVVITDKEVIGKVEAFLSTVLRIHKSAIKVEYIQKIPKNESGKTIYARIMEVFE